VELITYRRKGHAEHDNQSYVPDGEIEWWAANNDPIDRYVAWLTEFDGATTDELAAIDSAISAEIDAATDEAEKSPMPEALDALIGIYGEPATIEPHWYRKGVASAVESHERPASWGTHDG
jgi:TPP-dependent pyruvate/acetoin dehydrogenase alpha subunit